MSHITGHRCDTCGATDPTHPDDGPPVGWFLVALMKEPSSWEQEWHFCSPPCLVKVAGQVTA